MTKEESTAFGELLGLIEVRDFSPTEAVDIADAQFDTADREVYEDLVQDHWNE